jgi:hypothetical protein
MTDDAFLRAFQNQRGKLNSQPRLPASGGSAEKVRVRQSTCAKRLTQMFKR